MVQIHTQNCKIHLFCILQTKEKEHLLVFFFFLLETKYLWKLKSTPNFSKSLTLDVQVGDKRQVDFKL